jgi:hypothetical protein
MSNRRTAADYSPDDLPRVRQTCLYVLSSIPAELRDAVTIVGGLVPSLLVPLPPEPGERHLGTADLDIGLALSIRGDNLYTALTGRLLTLGFEPERVENGRPASIRWKSGKSITPEVLVDILPALLPGDHASPAATIPGLGFSARTGLAFLDRERVELSGESIVGKRQQVSVWVCGPGAYLVIKSLTFEQRGFSKDAYDLFYVLKNYGAGVGDVFNHLAPLITGSPEAQRAIQILHDDFADPNGDGAVAVPLFLYGRRDDDIQADVAGFTNRLLAYLGMAL